MHGQKGRIANLQNLKPDQENGKDPTSLPGTILDTPRRSLSEFTNPPKCA
jgi:hypothetical protein